MLLVAELLRNVEVDRREGEVVAHARGALEVQHLLARVRARERPEEHTQDRGARLLDLPQRHEEEQDDRRKGGEIVIAKDPVAELAGDRHGDGHRLRLDVRQVGTEERLEAYHRAWVRLVSAITLRFRDPQEFGRPGEVKMTNSTPCASASLSCYLARSLACALLVSFVYVAQVQLQQFVRT